MINPKLFHMFASMQSAKEISLTDVLSDVSPSNKSSALASYFSSVFIPSRLKHPDSSKRFI